MKNKVGYSLELVGAHFWKFVKRLFLFIFFYGRFAFISCGLSILVPVSLHAYLGMPYDVSITIMRILLTVTPIFPTAVYAVCKEEDYDDEFSMDLCFAVWLISIVCAWWII